jgi:hypothetical protein
LAQSGPYSEPTLGAFRPRLSRGDGNPLTIKLTGEVEPYFKDEPGDS